MFVERIQVRYADPRKELLVSRHHYQVSLESRGGDQSIHRRNGIGRAESSPSLRDALVDRDDPVAKLDQRSQQPVLQCLGCGWISPSYPFNTSAQFTYSEDA